MFLLAISDTNVGLSLFIVGKLCLSRIQKMCRNISKILRCHQIPKNRNLHLCPKEPGICKISQQIILKLRNSEQILSNYLIPKELW